jgi:translocator protein
MQNRWLVLLGFFGATFAAAALGSVATSTSVGTWYAELSKPSWNPPSWVFGPVWTTLYVLIAIAGWRVWLQRENPGRRAALILFFAQLGLNALWSVIFFGLREPGWAVVEILGLWTALVVLLGKFWSLDRLAALLWLPYVLWVSFATVLNATVWWLNRSAG